MSEFVIALSLTASANYPVTHVPIYLFRHVSGCYRHDDADTAHYLSGGYGLGL